ncbi:hypothetical protein MMC08_005306 [Hypocenomyce scalaris]|nr:hypothetical protein [Hypocenomyce scalaris]
MASDHSNSSEMASTSSPNDVESFPKNEKSTPNVDLEELGEKEGYVLDSSLGGANLKTTENGRTILIPQPSEDPNDPLNWSWFRKHLFLIIIGATSFLPDYGSATGAVTLIPQSIIWKISENEVNHSQVGNVFMLGAGGVFVVAFSAYFGRYPILFWFMILAVATAIWCTAATTFHSFMAARILNGFFSTVAQGGGLMFIKDLFYLHEHARKINIWAAFVVLSPYFGPLFTAFIISTQKWQWAFGLYSIETGLCLIAIILFFDETFYNRRIPRSQQPPRRSRLMRMVGIEQWRSRSQRSSFFEAMARPLQMIIRIPVLLSFFYYLLTFAWVVGINTTLSIFLTPLYHFGPKQIGFFYFTPIVAAILGEFAGHWLHDLLATSYQRRHAGRLEPEARLLVLYLSTPFLVSGLVLLGFSLQNGYHYMLTALGWGLYVFGIMLTTVGISAYMLDSYPEGSGEVAAWLNAARTTGGFLASYFQVDWATAMGAQRSFGIQAGICAAAFGLVVVLQVWGKRLRLWSGQPKFKTI